MQDLTVIGHYSQSANQEQADQELAFFSDNIQRDLPNTQLIVLGDLNRNPERADNLATRLNLR